MKPTVAADEMFPEGVGPYMDMEEVLRLFCKLLLLHQQICRKKITPQKCIF